MKKAIILLSIFLLLSVCLCGCTINDFTGEKFETHSEESNFVKIDGYKDLYYYAGTNIVYIIFNEMTGVNQYATGYGYMAPYYSSNGKLCTYNPEIGIVEVDT